PRYLWGFQCNSSQIAKYVLSSKYQSAPIFSLRSCHLELISEVHPLYCDARFATRASSLAPKSSTERAARLVRAFKTRCFRRTFAKLVSMERMAATTEGDTPVFWCAVLKSEAWASMNLRAREIPRAFV